jgi:signal transduction histidine kinase
MAASARINGPRMTLATQLHSVLLNEIGALIAQSQICERSVAMGDGRSLHEVARLREMLRGLEDSTRELIDAAMNPGGSMLSDALQREVNEFQAKHPEIGVKSSVDDVAVVRSKWPERLATDIVHEALANAARHGKPSRVEVTATAAKDGILIRIRDNGRGFDTRRISDPNAMGAPGRYGIRIMNETAKSVEGRVEISSALGRGTQVTLFIPFRARPPQGPPFPTGNFG